MLSYLKYVFRDKDEVYWMFRFENVAGLAAWYIYQQRPGDLKLVAKGRITEEEIEQILSLQPSKLEPDMIIDLNAWMQDAGIDEMTESFKIVSAEKNTNGTH